ncbi:hypothetical protein An01g00790 [Aspergillus niger]|uniref:Uncharacterized protein n=2 Tax=Aspergillus niger TaxID=5061 RepID=A2Q7I1_ASPNC|nr:hypothetical protein An01g00790 [Aspergillus niger]CAK43457.1 hypothetical protein An01g00790 [Aspergillus niger]
MMHLMFAIAQLPTDLAALNDRYFHHTTLRKPSDNTTDEKRGIVSTRQRQLPEQSDLFKPQANIRIVFGA